METSESPWIWKKVSTFGAASMVNFHDQFVLNGTNSTEAYSKIYSEESNGEYIERIFGFTTGLILILNLLFTIKDKKSSQRTVQNSIYPRISEYVFYFIVSLLLSPLTIAIFLLFTIYRTAVYLFLLLKYRGEFGGLLDGADQVWAVENKSKSIITVMLSIESDEDVDVCDKVRGVMRNICEDNWKFRYHRIGFGGYYFWKKGEIDMDDHVRKVCLDRDGIGDFIGKYSNVEFPKNHRTNWDVFIGKDSSDGVGKKVTVVIARLHHTIGDGVALMSMFLKQLKDNEKDIRIKRVDSNESLLKQVLEDNLCGGGISIDLKRIKDSLRGIFEYIYLIFFGVGFSVYQFLIRGKDNNVLHGQELTGDKIIEWVVEEEYSMFDAIKRIKNRINGTTFNDVVLTAISSSFYEYMKKKNDLSRPREVTVVIPLRMEPLETVKEQIQLNGNVRRQKVSDKCHLTNRFSMAMLNLPIFPQNDSQPSLLKRLSIIKNHTQLLRHSPDILVNYLICSILTKILPEFIIAHIFDSAHNTAAVSNMPGPPQMNILNGCKLNNLMFWLPNKGTTGVGVSILSYGNRIQLGLLSDKAIINNKHDARFILQNIHESIKQLDQLTTQQKSVE